MAASYGFDVSRPAASAREAVQWVYFGYLGAVKEQDGAAMSMGRIDAFLDTYFERDLAAGRITEAEAQEMIDQFGGWIEWAGLGGWQVASSPIWFGWWWWLRCTLWTLHWVAPP